MLECKNLHSSPCIDVCFCSVKVTRKRHTDDIKRFLAEKGVVVAGVNHLRPGQSKADFVLDPALIRACSPSCASPRHTFEAPHRGDTEESNTPGNLERDLAGDDTDASGATLTERTVCKTLPMPLDMPLDIPRGVLLARPVVVFVDDDVREHLDPHFIAACAAGNAPQEAKAALESPAQSLRPLFCF